MNVSMSCLLWRHRTEAVQGPDLLYCISGDEPTVYMMDILEEAGPDIARRCYWDFGKWSDLWRVWRPISAERPSRDAAVGLPVSALQPPDDSCLAGP